MMNVLYDSIFNFAARLKLCVCAVSFALSVIPGHFYDYLDGTTSTTVLNNVLLSQH